MKYNPQKIESKWQKYWEKEGIYNTKDEAKGKENKYILLEFPYPSGDLHIGHWYAFSIPDIYVRWLRMQGKYNVMNPIGFDSFGLPAENAAIKRKIHPKEWTDKNIDRMRKQLKSFGATFDWQREVIVSHPDYYKWTQWLFIQFFKKGLAYRDLIPANWCLSCKTVLANEQVIDGLCERCGSEAVQKEIEQWMFKITNYSDRLIDDIEKLDWPETAKTAQKNWIGRSQGAEITFEIKDPELKINTFTTRIDTLFGATYLVLAPEHELVKNLESKIQNLEEVKEYIKKTKSKTELERISEKGEKTGIELKGVKAVNPANNKKIPIWIADYILKSYGTGAIMAVPAHDGRDYEFAKKFKLPTVKVILPPELQSMVRNVQDLAAGAQASLRIESDLFTGDGTLVNSGKFDGLDSKRARLEITKYLKEKGSAEEKTNYRLRDWIISRQRYWGAPIPMIYCEKCGWQPVPEKDLPVLLPEIKNYTPTGDGKSPLAKSEEFVNTKCPKCNGEAKRETDTIDTFVDSSWYFLRYADSKNKNKPFDKLKIKKWLPVDLYVGGAEHNTMHLLYARFFTKVLFDLKLIDFKEPFTIRKNHGIILGSDGHKMSKSRGNVVNPDELVEKYGADTVRMYLAFMGPYGQGGPWNPTGINGVYRFLNRVRNLSEKLDAENKENPDLEKSLHKAIKKIGNDIEKFHFNTGVSELMKLINKIEKFKIQQKQLETFLKLLSPFAPHLTEEIWKEKLGNKESIHLQEWPVYDPKLIMEEEINLVIQINGKTRDIIRVPRDISEDKARELSLASEKIKKHLGGKKIKKFIYIPNRLTNVVV